MRLREMSLASAIALLLGIVGLVVGACGLIQSNPYLGLFGITIVCCGGISAMMGLQD